MTDEARTVQTGLNQPVLRDGDLGAASAPQRDREPARRANGPADTVWGPVLFVWGAWGLMLLAALAYTLKYGRNVPVLDDWVMVPYMIGEEPVTASWLWSQHAEHRIPLARLTLLALLKATGYDFRAGMYLNVFCLAALAFAMVRVAAVVRGRVAYADAFFPVALLNWGHCDNILWCWQIAYMWPTVLVGTLLLIVVTRGARLRLGDVLLAGACLVLLPLCGALGLVFVPALALWLGYAGVVSWRSGQPGGKRNGFLSFAGAGAALALLGVYFIGYSRSHALPVTAGPLGAGKAALNFLSFGLGPSAVEFWPNSTYGVAGVVLLSVGLLAWAVWRAPTGERPRALSLLLFLGANACLALALGWGRMGIVEWRYVTLAVPMWCGLYYLWVLYGPRRLGSLPTMCLFFVMAAQLSLNFQVGNNFGKKRSAALAAFENDLAAGEPPCVLLSRHLRNINPYGEVSVRLALQSLHDAGVSPYQNLQPDPPFQEVKVPVEPTDLHQITWDNGQGQATGDDPHLVITLPKPRFVYAIRLRIAITTADNHSPRFRVVWKKSGEGRFAEDMAYTNSWLQPGMVDIEALVWLSEPIDAFRIHPDSKPCTFRISEVMLLVPATDPPSAAR
jgi:hypothetical protein